MQPIRPQSHEVPVILLSQKKSHVQQRGQQRVNNV